MSKLLHEIGPAGLTAWFAHSTGQILSEMVRQANAVHACRVVLVLTSLMMATVPAFAAATETDERPFSKTVDEAVQWVLAELPEETRAQVAHIRGESLVHLHFGLGLWIRNNVPVWGNEELLRSLGDEVHPDDVGGMILRGYWEAARAMLPEERLARIEHFEATTKQMAGEPPTGAGHRDWIDSLNEQIARQWPADAPHAPFRIVADEETYFTSELDQFADSMESNLRVLLSYHRSLAFYAGDTIRIGDPPGGDAEGDGGE